MTTSADIKELQANINQRLSFFNEYYNFPNRRPFWQQFIIDVFVLILTVTFIGLFFHSLFSLKNSQ